MTKLDREALDRTARSFNQACAFVEAAHLALERAKACIRGDETPGESGDPLLWELCDLRRRSERLALELSGVAWKASEKLVKGE